jgi:two-component system, NarL family, uhpT operon response regulator UhpA
VLIAIVDDHALFRESVTAWLQIHEPDIITVRSVDSVDKLPAAVDVDVVLLDIDLGPRHPPASSSVRDVVAGGAAVLVVSALAHPRLVRQALTTGALGYVPKHEPPHVLAQGLRTVARGELFLTPDLAAALAESGDDVPSLSPQELRALRLYASGLKMDSVARRLGVSPATVREYLDRVKRKYEQVGRPARTKAELWHVAAEDGHVPLIAYRETDVELIDRDPPENAASRRSAKHALPSDREDSSH